MNPATIAIAQNQIRDNLRQFGVCVFAPKSILPEDLDLTRLYLAFDFPCHMDFYRIGIFESDVEKGIYQLQSIPIEYMNDTKAHYLNHINVEGAGTIIKDGTIQDLINYFRNSETRYHS